MHSRPLLAVLILAGLVRLWCWVPIAVADADGPDYWAVNGVAQNDHLNLRKGPSVKFSVVARIPSGFKHLENLGCSPDFSITEWGRFTEYERGVAISLRWCRVRFEDDVGWVNGTYLQEGFPQEK